MTLTPLVTLIIQGALTVAALSVVLLVMAHWLRRQQAQLQSYALEIASLHSRFERQVEYDDKIAEVLKRLLVAAESMDSRLERLELRGSEPSYRRAIAVVQQGGGADALVRDYGLSQVEAELVSIVHARRASK
jgi:hypothetical protein